jgi:hypothetical protein
MVFVQKNKNDQVAEENRQMKKSIRQSFEESAAGSEPSKQTSVIVNT